MTATTATTAQAAEKLGVSVWTIRRRCRTGQLPAIKDARGRWIITLPAEKKDRKMQNEATRKFNEATRKFVADVNAQIFAATWDYSGERAKYALEQIAASVRDRDVANLSDVDPDEVELTDLEWRKLARKASMMAACGADEW